MPEKIQTQAERDVLRERQKQRDRWPASHDDAHAEGDLSMAGAFLALDQQPTSSTPEWLADLYQRHATRERFVMAAAFLIAEVERIDRAWNKADSF